MSSDQLPILPPAKYVERGAYSSAYFVLGDPAGTPIVLLHGLAANGLQFVDDAHWFAARGYYAIVPDLRGHGRSQFPQSTKVEDFTIAQMADDILAILDAEGIATTHWVGNSLGGILALEVMRSSPERLDRVIMFGTAFKLNIPDFAVGIFSAGFKAAGVALTAFLGGHLTSNHPEAQVIVRKMLSEVHVDPVLHAGTNVARYDLLAAAQSFAKPILMIRAENDSQVNDANRDLLPQIQDQPNFNLVDIRDAGHCANLDQPEIVRALIHTFVSPAADDAPQS